MVAAEPLACLQQCHRDHDGSVWIVAIFKDLMDRVEGADGGIGFNSFGFSYADVVGQAISTESGLPVRLNNQPWTLPNVF
jgi:hypothetical protein